MEQSVVPKRPREELLEPLEKEKKEALVLLDSSTYEESLSKRQKLPYNHILSLLELEEDHDSTQDLSPLITSLQQEITNSASNNSNTLLSQHNNLTTTTTSNNNLEDCVESSFTTQYSSDNMVEENDEGIMRHLLEASDYELGIPNDGGEGSLDLGGEEVFKFNGGGEMVSSLCDALWELEDEDANYYDLLHSQLFL